MLFSVSTWKPPEIKPKCLFAVLDFGVWISVFLAQTKPFGFWIADFGVCKKSAKLAFRDISRRVDGCAYCVYNMM